MNEQPQLHRRRIVRHVDLAAYEASSTYRRARRREKLDGFARACGLAFIFGIGCAVLIALGGPVPA